MGIVSRPLITGRCLETVNSPAPRTMVYGGMGLVSVHLQTSSFDSCQDGVIPLATARQPWGTATRNATFAFASGRSTVGIQNLARSGQLSANTDRLPRAFTPMIRPSRGLP